MSFRKRVAIFIVVSLPALTPLASPGDVRSGDRLAFVFKGARVVVAPGRVIDPGVVIVRGGVIEAVGPVEGTRLPDDAHVFDLAGKVVHPAFVDPYVPADTLAGRRQRGPQDEEDPEERRDAPPSRGPSGPADHPYPTVRARDRVVDTLQIRDRVAETYRRLGFAVMAAVPSGGIWRGRAAVVSLSDTPLSGRVLRAEAGQYASVEPDRGDGPGSRGYPNTKMGAMAAVRQGLLDALWWRDSEQAYTRASVGQARPAFVSSVAALVPAAEGKETIVFEGGDVLSLLRAGRLAREYKLKARYVGGGDEYRLLDDVVRLNPDLVLRVDFPKPERFDEDEWIDVPVERLRAFDRAPSNPKWLRDAGLRFSFTTFGLEKLAASGMRSADPEAFPARVREAVARGLSPADALAAVTTIPAEQLGLGSVLGSLERGKIANLVVASGEPFAVEHRVLEIWVDGKRFELPDNSKKETDDADARPSPTPRPLEKDVRTVPPREYAPLAVPRAVLVRGATVWTQGAAGRLTDADLLVVDGKVAGVGRGLTAPAGALVVDGAGKHVTPGLIDAHSHSAIDGGVNETGNAVTAEVRIRDVLDPFDVAIYRELAGGLTTVNALHGSANAIGGQNAILKLRYAASPDELPFSGAPEGIKFALGENPKRRGNAPGNTQRYPATRMGVASLIRERFVAARDYRRRQAEYAAVPKAQKADAIPPHPDLQLEAVAEILEGKRQVHCHSYRKDEILEMLRVAEEFGVRIATLQHVLEGYKVSDEIAQHGAGASCFSDWWAYKFEVYDAIPYAGPLMHERGVLVSFNSDSDELARRLNVEAAKAVKYGGLTPEAALSFVTSNPARQLGIASRVGSLEAGKDGDFVVWSGDPLDARTIALETWIEGRKYFDREQAQERRKAIEDERGELVARARRGLERDKRPGRERSGAEPAAAKTPEEPEKPTEAPIAPTPIPTAAPRLGGRS
jgi:imidazolonepropionase-like amidohydrolase